MTIEQAWDYLIENELFTVSELELVTALNGYTLETLESALYATYGYREIEQYQRESED